jgi:hypothetical protein
MSSERGDRELTDLLEAAQPAARPGLADRALAAMAEAVPQARVEPRGSVRRRVALAAALVVALVCGAWVVTGRRPEAALAQAAAAMAQVKSAHLTGVAIDQRTGAPHALEIWAKGPSKVRILTAGEGDNIHDGARRTFVELGSIPPIVHISHAHWKGSDKDGLTCLRLFEGPRALDQAVSRGHAHITKSESMVLPGGRPGTRVEVTSSRERWVFSIDMATKLLASQENYLEGQLRSRVDRIEYDVAIADAVFTPPLPKGALVLDTTGPVSERQRTQFADRRKAADRISGGLVVAHVDPGESGQCETPFHHGTVFEVGDSGGMVIVYLESRNAYRVFGRALVREWSSHRVVRDEEVVASTRAHLTVAQWKARQEGRQRAEEAHHARAHPPELLARWDRKGKELKAEGAVYLTQCGGEYWPAGNTTGGCTFEALEGRDNRVWYSPSREEYYIMGKARIHREGFDRTVEDDWVKVPGPRPELPERR